MPDYDLVIAGGTVVTPADMFRADIGITGGLVQAIGFGLNGARTLDANGMLVMPGGVDTHCHIEQLRADGSTDEETFVTGSTSALAGGTTSVITFSIQFKGQGISAPLAEYRRLAASSMVDYSFHQIITDASDDVIFREVPEVVASGIRSLKVFLTYDPLHLDDRQF
ncbi:MAG TPA: amidohydrolase family protein, partial [Acetobacteraceae bacterium]|nr:amidohydrolase family protein [Acetobacteraceae bacterium]